MKTQQDWNGGNMYATLGASNHSSQSRVMHDFYATPPTAVDALLPYLDLEPETKIYEPCCGMGHVAKVLSNHGYQVIAEDLYDYGFGISGKNFLQQDSMPEGATAIITNFPYAQVTDFTLHALDLLRTTTNGILCSFVKTTFIEGQGRYNSIFKQTPPSRILQFVKRQGCGRNGVFSIGESSAVAYAWFVWEAPFVNEPPRVYWVE